MARSRRSAPRPAPRPAAAPAAAHRPAPPPVQAAPPPPAPVQHSSGGGSMIGGMLGMVGQGLAFGTGSAVAHRAVDAVMGPRTVTHEHVTSAAPADATAAAAAAPAPSAGADACSFHAKAFADCVQSNGSDIAKCQFYMDMLNDCKRNSSGMS